MPQTHPDDLILKNLWFFNDVKLKWEKFRREDTKPTASNPNSGEQRKSRSNLCRFTYFVFHLAALLLTETPVKKKKRKKKRKKKVRNKSAFWPQTALIRVTEDRSVGSVRSTGHPELHTREKNTLGGVWVGRYRSSLVSTLRSGSLLDTSNGRASSLTFDAFDWSREREREKKNAPSLPSAVCAEGQLRHFHNMCRSLTLDLFYWFVFKIKVHLFSLCCGSVISHSDTKLKHENINSKGYF